MLTMFLKPYFRRIIQLSKYSTGQKISVKKDHYGVIDPIKVLSDPTLSYQDVFYLLNDQARRTMLLHVNSSLSVDQNYLNDQVQNFCSSFGEVVYCSAVAEYEPTNYFLVEFSTLQGIQSLSSHSAEGMLTLRMAELSPSGLNLSTKQQKPAARPPSVQSIVEKIRNASNISEQVSIFYHNKRASSDCVRKKIFLPSLFQDFFNWHMKTDITAVLFGTSFSTFCTPSSDVDISLTHLSDAANLRGVSITSLNHLPVKSAQMYKSLQRAGTNAMFTEACKHIGKYFPGVQNLSTFDALFPLISFFFTPFQIPVDISFNNRPSVQSSWLINTYTRNDDRVAPFLFLIREWGKQAGVTRHGGAHYDGLTPYMLTCLGLFYLMRCQPYVLPPMMDMLTKTTSDSDIILGGFRTKFNDNLEPLKSSNTDSLEKLLMGFFHYYRNFDFQNKSVHLSLGQAGPSFYNTLDMKIPFTSQNVGKGCSIRNLNNFKRIIENVLRKLEVRNRRDSNWGIMRLIDVDAA